MDEGPSTGVIRPWWTCTGRRTLQVMQCMPVLQLLQDEVPLVVTRMLTAKQVEDRLGVDASTVYRMAADGRLQGVRVGRQWRFPPEAVDQLLALPSDGDGAVPGAGLAVDVATAVLEAMAPALGVTMVVTDLDGIPMTPLVNPAPAIREQQRDPGFLTSCTSEWSRYAQTPHLAPRFEASAQGFRCAHSLVRKGASLVAMVLAGGIAPYDAHAPLGARAPDGAHAPLGAHAPDGGDGLGGHDPADGDGLFHLDDDARRRVLDALPRTAAALSRLASLGAPGTR